MIIKLTEPTSPHHIHINPVTNKVHLLVPVVGGQEISTDNTCEATTTLKKFFDGGALGELNTYKSTLEFDIGLLKPDNPLRLSKEARLTQIAAYIEAVKAMRYSYAHTVTASLKRPSNLYNIQLMPREQDDASRVFNPVFYVDRRIDAQGTPLSALYNAMHLTFPGIAIPLDPRAQLTAAALAALPASPAVADIQRILSEQFQNLFRLTVHLTQGTDSRPVDKIAIDSLMGFDDTATPKDYIDALLGMCVPQIWGSIPISPFYSIPQDTPRHERTDRLSIITQFFLANLNIYCKAKGISTKNFGAILDASLDLSTQLAQAVSTAMNAHHDVEETLCAFCNAHAEKFGLSRVLTTDDMTAIKQKFARTYQTVTATKENPHMDDFMILDKDASGETAKFVTHQGAICINFAEIVPLVLPNQGYFAHIRQDFATHPAEIPHKNEFVAGEIDVEIEVLLAKINEEQFEKLPQAIRAYPLIAAHRFLRDVARGKQDEAEQLLTVTPANAQTLLQTSGVLTDYSGRTFNCTAYEYAYWAKDTHMCRMLERQMDEATKTLLLERIEKIERIDAATGQKIGLTYQQNGTTHRSAHFDLTELKTALRAYIEGFDGWSIAGKKGAIKAAWWRVGIAQRDIPAHVAQEYCSPYDTFYRVSSFDLDREDIPKETLRRTLSFYNLKTASYDSWFPLPAPNAGLGFDFVLTRGSHYQVSSGVFPFPGWVDDMARDLAALIRLDEERTADLTLTHEHLNTLAASHGLSI